MSGLLGGVLPAIFSQADRAKRYIGGLLADPVGRMQQAGGQAVDDLSKLGLLSEQAFNDPRNPMKLQDNAAARQLTDTYLNSVLNFAPVGMFVGPKSATWDKAASERAQALAQKGVDPRQIWKETGTFKGPDGMWRQEIDDSAATFIDKFRRPNDQEFRQFFDAKVAVQEIDELKKTAQQSGDFSIPKFYGERPGLYEKYKAAKDAISNYERQFQNPTTVKKGPLGNFLDHDKLDAAYPSLYDIPTTHNKNHSGGTYFENMNELLIGGGTEKSVTLHELQHAIQGKEGWGRGGSPDTMPTVLESLLQQKKSEAKKFGEAAYRNDPLGPVELLKPGARAKQLAAEKEAQKLQSWLGRIDEFGQSYSDEAYRNLMGEAEARATQARMNMNMGQRREVFPLDSYDVPLDQLILRR